MSTIHWILLRGLARYSDHWRPFEKELSNQLPQTHIHHLNTLGNGPKCAANSPITIAAYTDDLRKDFKKLKLPKEEKKILVAVSLGGMIALDWVSRFKDFDHAIIINTSARDLGNPLKRFSPFALTSVGKILGKPGNLYSQEKAILELVTNHGVTEELVQWHVELQQKFPTSWSNFGRQMIAAAKFKSPDKLKVPATFIVSQKDKLVASSFSERMAEKYHTNLFVHPTAGHDLGIDDPSWLAKKLKEELPKF
jgi:pimeloyl-ACP methyl ester carboxylesterase